MPDLVSLDGGGEVALESPPAISHEPDSMVGTAVRRPGRVEHVPHRRSALDAAEWLAAMAPLEAGIALDIDALAPALRDHRRAEPLAVAGLRSRAVTESSA